MNELTEYPTLIPFSWPEIESDRLLLRALKSDDVQDVFEYASDPRVSQYLSWEPHQSTKDSEKFLQWVFDKYDKQEPAPWAIVEKDSQKVIGTCGFLSCNTRHRFADIAYILGSPSWGKGYMPEAVRSVIGFGFEHIGLHRIEAQCRVENVASARVMEKAGMTRDGLLRQRFCLNGVFHDAYMYSILREEYLS